MNRSSNTRQATACFLLALLVTVAALFGQDVKTIVGPNQDFAKFKKYAWRKTHLGNAMVPDDVQRTLQYIRNAGNRELAQRGYWEDNENPDFYIEVATLGIPDVNLAQNVGPLYTYDGYGTVNPQYGAAPGTTMWMNLISRAQITATDRASNKVVWQVETLKKYKDPKKAMKNLEQEINNVMKKALSSFPSNQKAK